MPLKLDIISPQKTLLESTDVTSVTIPAHWGQMGILPDHTDFMTTLTRGKIVYQVNGREHEHEIESGFFEIKDNQATILVHS